MYESMMMREKERRRKKTRSDIDCCYKSRRKNVYSYFNVALNDGLVNIYILYYIRVYCGAIVQNMTTNGHLSLEISIRNKTMMIIIIMKQYYKYTNTRPAVDFYDSAEPPAATLKS